VGDASFDIFNQHQEIQITQRNWSSNVFDQKSMASTWSSFSSASDIISNDVAASDDNKIVDYAARRAFVKDQHERRECTPCRFFHDTRRGCLISDACVHCHDEHTKHYVKFAKKRNRAKKIKEAKLKLLVGTLGQAI
jgi:hypothetical protein